ncbi:uncharacterized protein LOC111091889 [Canis lupus familiaris]|uniref:uncharacterized protein LOC118352028 n=1 Tax=Canis lupus dingo TaxID=286419 RepID=UPI0015F14AD0|nr:uncharacterized protein LOC118352028 [Canis lupus dingo]XP_038288008.1 uncharacterized protein LOC111091889 [Canis lupus familiaris]XP_038426548.1 uncharacterized protein LOC111091889 [Canis lupus familiaris]
MAVEQPGESVFQSRSGLHYSHLQPIVRTSHKALTITMGIESEGEHVDIQRAASILTPEAIPDLSDYRMDHLSGECDFSVALHKIQEHHELLTLSPRGIGLKTNNQHFAQLVRAAFYHLLASVGHTGLPFMSMLRTQPNIGENKIFPRDSKPLEEEMVKRRKRAWLDLMVPDGCLSFQAVRRRKGDILLPDEMVNSYLSLLKLVSGQFRSTSHHAFSSW